ncbi:hypothetical protein BTO09_13430 [Gilvibacter sp. SZ-19]|uniref:hypothetical protein n=1 Tax=Gilvibacter sp. SZ-19 TaxID=754429 RepID=UPI000B3C4D9F|nr:hypothetical protein [Gilvibacter sp. SZ-19]ARV13279.1 hypothetical protein BTO09_13430 [Gilvibacter sp. SZ-19]
MHTLSNDNRQITLIYNGNHALHRRVRALCSATKKALLTLDISQEKISQTLWAEIESLLPGELHQIVDLKETVTDSEAVFSKHDLMKILEKNPDSLSFPLLFYKATCHQIKNEAEVLRFINVDSGGFEKTMHTQAPKVKSLTREESFRS